MRLEMFLFGLLLFFIGIMPAVLGNSIGLIVTIIGVLVCLFSSVPVTIIEKEENIEDKTHRDPYEILKMRYAKGEITEEEYEKMKKKLEG